MNCPVCGNRSTEVLETRRRFTGTDVERRHECSCGVRWLSVQKAVRSSVARLETRPAAYPSTTGRPPAGALAVVVSPTPPSDPILSLRADPDPERAIPVLREPALLVFPCDGNPNEFAVTETLRAKHAAAYPSLDVIGEYRKALVWVEASPENRKTARGMGRFLVRWLGRAQDDRRRSPNGQHPQYQRLG